MLTDIREVTFFKVKPYLSYEAFLQQYMGYHAEWENGEVIVFMAASRRHQLLVLWLSQVLNIFVQSYDLGVMLIAPFNMKLAMLKRGREPDILFVSQARQVLIQENHLAGAADLVIEIISPESVERDRVKKMSEYEAAGVQEYWLIDPETEQAEFYQLSNIGKYQLVSPDIHGIYHSNVLTGLQLEVAWLWLEPLPKVLDVARAWRLV